MTLTFIVGLYTHNRVDKQKYVHLVIKSNYKVITLHNELGLTLYYIVWSVMQDKV